MDVILLSYIRDNIVDFQHTDFRIRIRTKNKVEDSVLSILGMHNMNLHDSENNSTIQKAQAESLVVDLPSKNSTSSSLDQQNTESRYI